MLLQTGQLLSTFGSSMSTPDHCAPRAASISGSRSHARLFERFSGVFHLRAVATGCAPLGSINAPCRVPGILGRNRASAAGVHPIRKLTPSL
jgi:hypothetical protein